MLRKKAKGSKNSIKYLKLIWMNFSYGNLWPHLNKLNAFLKIFLNKNKHKSNNKFLRKNKSQLRIETLLKKWYADS